MARMIPSKFIQYELTQEEQLNSEILPTLVKYNLQNLMVMYAHEKDNLVVDNNLPDTQAMRAFATAHASATGKIELIQYLLDASDLAEKTLRELNQPSNKE